MPLTIDDGHAAARIAPELGGMVLQWWSRRGSDVLHWLWPVPDELIGRTVTPKGGMFVLAPFSNRIRAGAFDFRGRARPLEPHPEAVPHAQHGYANRLPWRVVRHEPAAVTLALDGLGAAWPWPVRMEQVIALERGALVATLACENLASEPMPFGAGFHPFFTRTGGQRLAVAARRVWQTDPDTRPLASEATAPPLDASLDPLTIGRFLGEWDGRASVTFPSLGAAVAIEADPTLLPWLLLFCPPGRPIVCVEPVSHLTGAFELPEPEARAQGMRVLEPGERFDAALRLVPLLDQDVLDR
ncbi:MAG TPA: hypothetical protein VFG43_12780 [Geminicoccaceae bacterium]|nr:hypothetical protein [Geminicoccaceae bacterium]